jgi:hypothetical protein
MQYFCSFPNDKAQGGLRELYSDDPAAIAAFTKRWDIPGRGVYQCVNPLRLGSTRRCIENVAAIERIPADLDFKDLEEAAEEIDARLLQLPVQPTEVRNSGGGRHIVYELAEPIEADDSTYFERGRAVLKRLAACLSADPAPAHPAALLRMPGSHNSKREGEPVLVEALWGSGLPVDITDIESMLDDLPEQGIFRRKPNSRGGPGANGHTEAAANGYKEPVDVGRRLASMQLEGPGDSAIHPTQVQCTASLLRDGISIDEVVVTVLEATIKAAAGDPRTANWNWPSEERAIRKQCISFIRKHPELEYLLPAEARAATDNGVSDVPSATRRIRLLPFDEVEIGDEPEYLVRDLIPAEGLTIVWGPPKSHKSFWTFDLAMHVALGRDYRGHAVQQGTVIYCAFEGQQGFRKRIVAFRQRFLKDHHGRVPFYLQPLRLNLIKEARLLISASEEQLGGEPPRLIVLDTLNRSLVGSESKDEDMAAYIAAADLLRQRFACAVAIVHHCGIEASRPRGHTSLAGAGDAQLAVKRAGTTSTLTVEFMKDGDEGTVLASQLTTVEISQDRYGAPITSCILVEAEKAVADQDTVQTKLSKNQTTMLSLLHGIARGLTTSEWNERAREIGLGSRRHADLHDLRTALVAKKLVTQSGGRWVVTSSPCGLHRGE